jgi:aminopeptidase N
MSEKANACVVKNTAAMVSNQVHVVSYVIHIDTLAFGLQQLRARTSVKVISLVNNLSSIPLSLLKLNIDSIYTNTGNLFYSYNDTLIAISTPVALMINDTLEFTVSYSGNPQQDASWGGFYFGTNEAFNMGVGFDADPHNFGRVWFPCIDEFTDKSTYEFYITTPSALKAYCNGYLIDSIINSNGTITWHWIMQEPIPSYLACMAVANYTSWNRNYAGIPIEIAALAGDTSFVTATFTNLPTALNTFIDYYGSYPFNKVGYSLVNFSGGAMEHAGNISIGRGFINGTLTYETLWAHELSHMWWGDKVTCKTAEDMWLNEGWATFNEALFTEAKYGLAAYKTWIRNNHRKVLQFTHIKDNGYHALNAVPKAFTYGATAYQKGADIVHTLRNFLTDSLFKNGAQLYQNTFAYSNAASEDLRDAFTTATGIDHTRFFDDWVFTPGFPHFSIDSVIYFPGGLDHYFVFTRQRNKGSNGHIYSMPVEITFSNGVTDTTLTILIDSATNVFHLPLIIANAEWIALDRNEKISDAITDYEKIITTTGNQQMPETNATLVVQQVGTSPSTVRVEHNWVAPDGFKQSNPGIRLSDYHYWRVDGLFNPGFASKITFQYNGSVNLNSGYIDNSLITGREDSLVILFRENTAEDWRLVSATHTMGSPLDKVGSFTVDTLQKGEYALGYRDFSVGIPFTSNNYHRILAAQPNPANTLCKVIVAKKETDKSQIKIYDITGKQVYNTTISKNQTFINWNCSNMNAGTYYIQLWTNGIQIDSTSVIVNK